MPIYEITIIYGRSFIFTLSCAFQFIFSFMVEKYGICLLSMIPVRSQPAHSSEMVNQFLYGESFAILEEMDDWVRIAGIYDGYEGWITRACFENFGNDQFEMLEREPYWVLGDPIVKIKNVNTSEVFFIPGGSSIYKYKDDDLSFEIMNNWFQFLEKPKLNNIRGGGNIAKIAYRFIHSPYLWGGRTALGMDCSGYTQIVYKMLNIGLPRDASHQVNKGITINFLSESKEGDLAFFDDEEGNIDHVGILLSNSEVIHASGMVRIDAIDQTGIYNRSRRKYTHKLRIIKRILS